MDDQTLISRAQGGDAAAFARLLDLYYDTIYRFAWKWCGHAANAEDIAQLACMKLATGLKQFRYQAAFTSWLYKLVINCAHDWQRSQSRHEHAELSELEPDAAESRAEDGIYLLQVLEQLAQLGEGMKETALLVHAEGLSHAEAGEILGVSESTISWRIHVIRRHMAQADARKSGVL
jgi:RNA polymerase sigma-70 factor, ECF subfamily